MLLGLLLLVGCDGAAAPGVDGAPGDPTPDLEAVPATIDVSLRTFDGGGDTYLAAALIDQAPPWPYEVAPVEGACRWSLLRDDGCVPGCEASAVCVDRRCVTPPAARSVGPLTLAGGGATRTVPFAAGYQLFERGLPWAPGVTLTASAPGAQLGALSLATTVPAPLAVLDVDRLRLRAGTPLVVRWTPADPGARVRLTLGADRGHAALRAALIECDAPDEAGAIAVPQAMVDRLADPGLWSCGDCYPHEVRRYRRVRGNAGEVPVALRVSQVVSLFLIPER